MAPVKDIWHIFSTLSVGGPQRRFAEYIARTSAGHRHHVYAMDGQYDALKLMGDKEPLHNGEQVIAKGNTLAATLSCRKFLKTHKPDLLVTYNWGATEWALANSVFPICPTIHIQDGFGEDEQDREKSSRRLLRKFAYRNCAKIIVPSLTLEKLARESWDVPPERLAFIPNGIHVESFTEKADAELTKSLGIKKSGKVIGTVAALRPEKNIGRMIEAFSLVEDRHPDSQLVIVGDGVGMP
ncbi:MAG: glycosyltransferase family 4 protein, partial [Kordiimonas sp.]